MKGWILPGLFLCLPAFADTPVGTESGFNEKIINNLNSYLSGLSNTKVPSSRVITTTAPLTGGQALSGDVTLSLPAASASVDGYLTHSNWSLFNGKVNLSGDTMQGTLNTLLTTTSSGVQFSTTASRPSASAGNRGLVWLTQGATGVAEVTTITVPSTAGSTQGDYFVVYNTPVAGPTSDAYWMKIDGNNTAPSGAAFAAATNTHPVVISTGGTAAQNATALTSALTGNAILSAVNNGNGTVTITLAATGSAVDITPHNEDDSGAGHYGVSIGTQGVTETGDQLQVVVKNRSAGYTWVDAASTFVTPTSSQLSDQAGTVVVDWGSEQLYEDFTNILSPNLSVDWGFRLLVDSLGNNTIDWDNRHLLDTSGNTVFDFSGGQAGLPIGAQLQTSVAQPTCVSGLRGLLWVVQGGNGVADILQLCTHKADNSYGWVTH